MKLTAKTVIYFNLTLLNLLSFSVGAKAQVESSTVTLDFSNFEKLAIQDGGRVKPFDTFARESVQLLTGTQSFKNKNPNETVLSWLFFPDEWTSQKFIQIKYLKLKTDLGYKETENLFSPIELIQNPKLASLFTDFAQRQKEKKKLDPYYSAIAKINNQLTLYQEIIAGSNLRLAPQLLTKDWLPVSDFKGELQTSFARVAQSYFQAIAKKDAALFSQAAKEFHDLAHREAPSVYPSENSLKWEVTYNKLHPFRWAYVFYLIAAIIFLLALRFQKNRVLRSIALVTLSSGLAIHIAGFVFRCLIAGRPPVSNMYESVIWVSLGCVVFGLILELIYKRNYIGLGASMMATIGLIIADSVPAVLDQSIKPLEPVLRSNYWLTIHVLTITLSYAAFALATGIGNIALSYYVRGKEAESREKLQALALFMYRAVQIGVLLLTAGTILGGVWADYSWGRFWGWDPKETWALIADLGYLAVLHGRFSGWLRTFGTIASIVCAFAGVIMAWYGVNFVLGVGLHSYGFGGGGVQYVAAILGVQLLYVGVAAYKHRVALRT
jgi:cytochrome c-type biogenesis protein CcsB